MLGFAAYFYLPDRPAAASWLSSEEKRTIERDLAADRVAALKTTKSFLAALQDPKLYLLSFIYFAFFCSLNTILLWAPSLLKRVGVVTATDIGYLSGIISIVSAVGMVASGYSSDRLMGRRWHVALCGFVASGCFLLLPLAAGSVAVTVALLAVASIAILSILSLFWTIPSGYLEGSAAAGGIAQISAIHTALSAVALLGAVGMIALILGVPSSRPSAQNAIRPIAPAD